MKFTIYVSAVHLLFGGLSGCASRSSGTDSCASASCQAPPMFPNPPSPAPSSMSAAPAPQPDPRTELPNALPLAGAPVATPDPLIEPPLTASERAELTDVEGVIDAEPWNGLRATIVTEEKVLRAYLDWKQRFYKTCSDGSSYILKTDVSLSNQVVSEGIGYGMLITVAVGDHAAFDGLWKHYRDRRNGMNWRYDPCGNETGGNGASDADLDAAMRNLSTRLRQRSLETYEANATAASAGVSRRGVLAVA